MSVFNLARQEAGVSCADCLDEVRLVACASVTRKVLDDLPLVVVHLAASAPPSELTAFAGDDHADADPTVILRVAAVGNVVDLEDSLNAVEVELRDERVRRLAGVAPCEPATERADGQRVRRIFESPSHQVELVRALVADVAVAGVPDPVPVVVELVSHDRKVGGRAEPQIVVNALRRRQRLLSQPYPRPVPVAKASHGNDLPDVAFVQVLVEGPQARVRTVLKTGTDDAAVLAGRLDHLAPLPDVVRHGLLDVDVLARLTGPYGQEGVPVVGGRRHDDVNVAAVHDAPHVGRSEDARPLRRLPLQDLLVRVAEGCDPHPLDLLERPQQGCTPASETDHGYSDVVVRPEDSRVRSERDSADAVESGLEYLAPRRLSHRVSPVAHFLYSLATPAVSASPVWKRNLYRNLTSAPPVSLMSPVPAGLPSK